MHSWLLEVDGLIFVSDIWHQYELTLQSESLLLASCLHLPIYYHIICSNGVQRWSDWCGQHPNFSLRWNFPYFLLNNGNLWTAMLRTDGVLGPVSMIDWRALQRARHGENIRVVLQMTSNSFSSVTTNKQIQQTASKQTQTLPNAGHLCCRHSGVILQITFRLKSSCLDTSSALHWVTCLLLNAPLCNTFKHPQLGGALW